MRSTQRKTFQCLSKTVELLKQHLKDSQPEKDDPLSFQKILFTPFLALKKMSASIFGKQTVRREVRVEGNFKLSIFERSILFSKTFWSFSFQL